MESNYEPANEIIARGINATNVCQGVNSSCKRFSWRSRQNRRHDGKCYFFLLDVASYALLSGNCVHVFFRLQTVMAEIEALAEV